MKRTSLEGLNITVSRIDRLLSEKEQVREQALSISRNLIRKCAEAIKALREKGRSDRALNESRELALRLRKVTLAHPDIYHSGAVENALQELAEAHILQALVTGARIPAPEAMNCTPAAYLLGMADAIGELRRMSQDGLRKGDFSGAEDALFLMEGLYSAINIFDYPDAIVPLKHKQDVARGLIEKTRGEVAVSVRGRNLEQKIAQLEKVLSRATATHQVQPVNKASMQKIR